MGANSIRTPLGVGSALRRARGIRGITLDEAARDTRLHPDLLRAIETEDFDVLGGEVYARATLRTYAGYLGLDPGKVQAAYARHAEDPQAPPPPSKTGRVERALAAARVRDNQTFLLGAAAVVLLVLIVTGFVSRRSTPVVTALPTSPSAVDLDASPGVDLVLVARAPIDVEIAVDGEEESFRMSEGESRSFEARSGLAVKVSDGGAVDVTVDGHELGAPGVAGIPWSESYPSDAPEVSISPSP